MPGRTVKRQLQNCDAALASDDGPLRWSKRSSAPFPREPQNAELKDEALRRAREVLHGTKHEEE
jgi:hypothetical protein